jgi:hypothetical protein
VRVELRVKIARFHRAEELRAEAECHWPIDAS